MCRVSSCMPCVTVHVVCHRICRVSDGRHSAPRRAAGAECACGTEYCGGRAGGGGGPGARRPRSQEEQEGVSTGNN